ncbi:TetR/AcrR family transcriptional regulator [Phenylobacterium sp.]|uniref:TetR/AcrR family transcriptional regulator n=1 Tax=Phenylobacterium sp. TaxID=1871053 RepID=UPI0025F83B29|nr:TetR/AcrR family transcriptional regulator [Phenylobacterium sp.]MBX3481957.1 TetR/AcrR family transcriptional regulator [Phenylobacterium sp.]
MSRGAARTGLAPRKAPVQARGQRSIEKLLAATHTVLRRDGAEAATTTAIAREAGVAVGSLYTYFPNKEAVILALYEQKLVELRAFAAEPMARGGTWRETLAAWITAIKHREREIGFDVALFDAANHYGRLEEIAGRHARAMAQALAGAMRALGSSWPDEALFELGLNTYYLNAASWLYWRALGRYDEKAVERLAAAAVAVMAEAFEDPPA